MSERVWVLHANAQGEISVSGPKLAGERVVVYERPDPGENRVGPSSPASDTSRQAALDNFPRSGSQRRRVLAAIVAKGEAGATRDQLAHELGLPDSGTDARVWELKQGGFIADTDRTRPTRLGDAASVLVATEKGRADPRTESFTDLIDRSRAGSSMYDPNSNWA